jgi:hypothetical protein
VFRELPHPKILQTLAQMEADGMLNEANAEAARQALAEKHPEDMKAPAWEGRIIEQLMERGLSHEAAEEQLINFS